MPLVLVRTVTGLEGLTAAELTAAGHRVVEVSKRQLVVEAAPGIVDNPPRLADDLFIVHAAVPDPGPTKAALAATALHLPGQGGAVAVTASFDGRRNFTRFDVEDLVGGALGGGYCSRRDGGVPPADRSDWRVVLDGKTMWVAKRPYGVPLHRRPWRRRTVVGSLHPPVAAAMARLARIEPGMRVVDPFCGAGTLLLEAHQLEHRAQYLGIDRRAEAIDAARANAADTAVRFRLGDGVRWREPVDRILTNPPWGVRLAAARLPAYRLRPGGLVVAIVMPGQVGAGWEVEASYDVAVAGRHPRIVVLRQWG